MRRFSVSALLGAALLAIPATVLGLTVDLDLATVSVDASSQEVVLTGTVTCDMGAEVTIGFAVTQGPAFVDGFETLTCTGSEQTWESRASLGTPRVHPGPATLDFGFSATLGDESIASGRGFEVLVAPGGALHVFGGS